MEGWQGDIVVNMSDDMRFLVPGYDIKIINAFADDLDQFIHFPDGQGKSLITYDVNNTPELTMSVSASSIIRNTSPCGAIMKQWMWLNCSVSINMYPSVSSTITTLPGQVSR
jgi:hypothetical protein